MLKDRQKGSFFGLIIGDAMGAPYEFKESQTFEVTKEYNRGGWLSVKKGEWTDDSTMALCVSESLIEKKLNDIEDQVEKYYMWFKNGYLTTRDECFDIGNTTRSNVLKFFNNKKIHNIKIDENSNNYANGGMMRLAPLPIFYFNSIYLIDNIIESTKVTHNSKVCIDSNIIYGQLIANAIKGYNKENLFQNINFSNIDEKVKERFFKYKEIDYIPNVLPTGNVLDCIELSIYALYAFNNYIDGLLWLLQFGNDSDTIGAIYGQLAGAIYGFESLDSYYFNNLIKKEELLYIFNNLITTQKS